MDSFGFSTFRFPIPETRQSSASRGKKGLPTVPNPEPSLEPEKYKTLTQVNSTGFRICHDSQFTDSVLFRIGLHARCYICSLWGRFYAALWQAWVSRNQLRSRRDLGNSQLGVGRTGVAPSELPQSRTSPRPDRSTQKIYHGKGQNHSSNLVISTPSSKGPSVLNSRVVQSPKVAMDHQRNGSVNPYLLFNLTVEFARDSQLCGGC